MKKKLYALLTALTALVLTAFTVADDILTRLNLEAGTAQRFILCNFTGQFDNEISGVKEESDYFRIPYTKKMLPAIIAGDKASAAKELCEYVKAYCSSTEFEKAYNKDRLAALPLRDNGADAGVLARNIEVYRINIRNYPNDKKYVAEQQQLVTESQARLDKLLEQAKGPFDLKKEWEAAYPADPAVAVRKRLQEYLTLVATVDFTAKLAAPDKYNKKKFINPAYEKKSLKWKAIFRAGKEVNDAVTLFVKDWLKGEIIAKEKITMTPVMSSSKEPAASTKEPTASASNSSNAAGTTTTGSTAEADKKTTAPVKEKKAFLNKLKNKAKAIVE
ncbi:MAG: hypothetical protein EOO09_16925 [Chitinophagaceae bacterium]|nr:MAG: hypothetical protein EOO09_16925 [Chitinophagaceae bacterium]